MTRQRQSQHQSGSVMMFQEFAQRCRIAFQTSSRGLDKLAIHENVSVRDNVAAQSSQLLALSAILAIGKQVDRATFLAGAGEAYDEAAEPK